MEEIFGLSMNVLMMVLLAVFLVAMATVVMLAWRNPVMLKLGLRNLPRRKGQTVLIIIGVMLSTVIMAAAFGTGDTLSFSIRNEVIKSLGPIDEMIFSQRANADNSLGSTPYIPYERFQKLQMDLAGLETIDGLVPLIQETVPAINPRTSLSEGRMRIVGIDPTLLQGFGTFDSISGEEVLLEHLADGEVYITETAAEELQAVPGDEIRLYLASEPLSVHVKGVIGGGGLSGRDPTIVLPLARAQNIFNRAGQVNLIVVSNRGNEYEGAHFSEEVTRKLRVLFTDREVASQLKALFNQEAVLMALDKKRETLEERATEDLSSLLIELQRQELSDELISLLGDDNITALLMDVIQQEELDQVERKVVTLFFGLAEFSVLKIKRDLLDQANEAGSFVTSFFIISSLFSIAVGILLIFLIFVMLAAARRSEMGMARAVGAKRRHLVQMFVFEGTAYSLISAAVGVFLGLAVSTVMIVILNRIFANVGGGDGPPEGFALTRHFEVRSAIVSYCLGMVITFATVTFSAYRVSRLNIVAAVRGLPTPITISTKKWHEVLVAPWRAFLRPFPLAWQAVFLVATIHPLGALTNLFQAIWAVVSFHAIIIWSTLQLFGRFFMQGWLAFLLGLLLTIQAIRSWERVSLFGGGVSLIILGLGLMLRTGLKRTSLRANVQDRIVFTSMGVAMLVFWSLPIDFFEGITGDLQGDFDVMFASGIAMVAAAVWTVMYNADLLVRALTFVTGSFGKLRPVLVTAVAYPMSSRFRTGLTLAMFSLVIFTLVVMSVLTKSFGTSFSSNLETISGGWDIEGNLNFNTPIENISQIIDQNADLRADDFEAIGGYITIGIQARQLGVENPRWHRYAARGADDEFLKAANYEFTLIADGYGSSGEEVWQGLMEDPSLAVIEGSLLPTRPGTSNERPGFKLDGVYYEDDKMSPVEIEVREPNTGAVFKLKVIGVLDRIHEPDHLLGMVISKSALDTTMPFPVPITTYLFRLKEGVDADKIARDIESSFLEHGMETEVIHEALQQGIASFQAFFNLFTGFMALGLFVGIAALGVVSTRAVVERRQQIGVLRAIGYRCRMVQLSFLLEFSFVALLGTAIGVILGTILGYNVIRDIRQSEAVEAIQFSVPWLQIGIIASLTYVFSLLATFLPARQASRIYPAEALRYE